VREVDRIREAYDRRAARGADDRYDVSSPDNRYLFERRRRDLLPLLGRHGLLPLAGKRILDVGCGNGGVLAEMEEIGADPRLMCGVDLLPARLAAARANIPAASFALADASRLPYTDASFDIALQFTLMSSVLEAAVRRAIAVEAMRVLQPGGVLIWYDFIWNPGNPDTRGIRLAALRRLYPGCAIDARRSTLAPPLLRLVAPRSLTLCRALDAVPLFRSHYLAAIRKPPDGA
jgi:ubiquinone/menaquinone biosynthesis C-methylase UbiE